MNPPKHIIFIGFGVSDYRSPEKKLAGPSKDPFLVYEAVRLAAGQSFSEARSVVCLNPTGMQFLSAIESAMAAACRKSDMLVLYYSGHAEADLNQLDLLLVDEPAFQGKCSINKLLDIHRLAKRPRTLLLLDCCHSGMAAATVFTNHSPTVPSNIQILTPTTSYELAEDHSEGSPFAHALSQALGTLVNENSPVTVSLLIREVADIYQGKTTIQHINSDEQIDWTIAHPQVKTNEFKKFAKTTYQRILTGRQAERESLWFALSDEAETLTLSLLERMLDEGDVEPSWSVRRAMGSALSSIKYLRKDAESLVERMLESEIWMHKVVGLNASKKILDPALATRHYTAVLASDIPMDARWLAALYLHDINPNHCLLNTPRASWGFTRSNWGRHELSKLLKIPTSTDEVIDDKLYEPDHLPYALALSEATCKDSKYAILKDRDSALRPAVLKAACKLLLSSPRGTTSSNGSKKWLRSKLYGSWRHAIDFDINSSLGLNKDERKEFLTSIPRIIPSVYHRMAIFEGSTKSLDDLKLLSWAKTDPHPWVRRVYLEQLSHHNFNTWQDTIQTLDWPDFLNVDQCCHPGQIDLIIQAAIALRHVPPSDTVISTLDSSIQGLKDFEEKDLRRVLFNEGSFLGK
ncbi:caspase family protein [Pseudomonas sp. NPDC089401]|uniref:caspase family protein n=1 Tax=Pseudomonas sp. NPDC089401 TaxID=3364462 RepID=UPI0037F19C6C